MSDPEHEPIPAPPPEPLPSEPDPDLGKVIEEGDTGYWRNTIEESDG
jgi:hypothetical protein